MKRNLGKIALILSTSFILASCNNVSWSWWSEDNLEIVRGISLEDAQRVVESASANYDHYKTVNGSFSSNVYYLDYIGSFASESDFNQTTSISYEGHRYTNNVKATTTNSTTETNYRTAHSVSSLTIQDYWVANDTTSITETYIEDFGYGNPDVTVQELPYSDTSLSVGQDTFAISWDANITYGYAQNSEVLIETYSTLSGTYTVSYTGAIVPTVTNTYTLYRFNPITLEDGTSYYALDYTVNTVETTTGFDIFYSQSEASSHALSEPFVLSYSRTVTSYSSTDNGAFDTSVIPVPVQSE